MPDLSTRCHVTTRRGAHLIPAALLGALVFVVSACSGGGAAPAPSGSAVPGATAGASPSLLPEALASLDPGASGEPASDLCTQLASVGERIAALRAVELRLPNRVALDIELGKLQAAFSEVSQADLGPFADQLETPLTRLGYRLGEVELAVEDFRTNSRPQRAAPHVESAAQTFADELAAFVILARC